MIVVHDAVGLDIQVYRGTVSHARFAVSILQDHPDLFHSFGYATIHSCETDDSHTSFDSINFMSLGGESVY